MRFFIALELPEEGKQQLKKLQFRVKQLIPDIRLTDSDKLHITIAFIGEQPDQVKNQLLEAMGQATTGITPFSVTPGYLDGFPTIHHPHTLWIGVKGDVDKLIILTERIKDALQDLELAVDRRRFIPHIAIGKFGQYHLDETTENKLQELMLHHFAPIPIEDIKLFESVPDRGLHEHNTLAEIKLVG